jgi:hypothetical protein
LPIPKRDSNGGGESRPALRFSFTHPAVHCLWYNKEEMGAYFGMNKKQGVIITAIVFLVLMIAPIVLMGFYYRTYNTLTTQELTKEQTLSDIASLALKIRLDKLTVVATSLASSPQLVSDAKSGQWTAAADVARDLENNVNFYDPFIDRMIIYDASGTQQAAYPALAGGLGTSASSSSWYGVLLGGDQSSYVTNVAIRVSLPRIQVVNIVVPIRSAQGVIGFLVLQIPTDNFLEFTADLSLGTYGFGYIVDPVGNIVAHPKFFSDNGSVVNYSSIPQVQKVMAGASGSDVVFDQGDNEKSIITYKPVAGYGWGIITQELYSEAFSTRSSILWGLAILIAIAVLVDILISYLVFRITTLKKND